jgi:phosphoacetylglucosamine mutase
LSVPARVFIGRDNRPSSEKLASLAREGLSALKAEIRDFGMVSTPQLHWAVRAANAEQPCDMATYMASLEKVWRQKKVLVLFFVFFFLRIRSFIY